MMTVEVRSESRRLNATTGPYAILFAGVVFSFGPLAFRGKSDESDEWQFLFYRSSSLIIAMTIALVVSHRSGAIAALRRGLLKNLLGGALMAGMLTSFIVAIARIDAATTLLLQSLAPFSAALLGWMLLREKVDVHTWVAMVLAVVGVLVIGSSWDTSDTVGIIVACVIPVLLGIYTVLLRDSSDRDAMALVFFAGIFGTVASLFVTGGDVAVSFNDASMGVISGGVILGSALPLFNAAGKHVPAVRTTLLLLTEIVLAPLWVWMFVDETPSASTLIGGAVILGALVWLATHPGKQELAFTRATA
jgi:drug/metabolite transporter, DME family